MLYIACHARTIDILKCASCKAYELIISSSENDESDEKWITHEYKCEKCGDSGTFRLSRKVNYEWFDSWEQLQDRVDELKVSMSLMKLELYFH